MNDVQTSHGSDVLWVVSESAQRKRNVNITTVVLVVLTLSRTGRDE